MAKNSIILAYFSENYINFALIFRGFERKPQIAMNFERFSKFFKIFLKEIAKNSIILAYFSKLLRKHALLFRALTRNRLFGNIEKSLKFSDKISIGKLNF